MYGTRAREAREHIGHNVRRARVHVSYEAREHVGQQST